MWDINNFGGQEIGNKSQGKVGQNILTEVMKHRFHYRSVTIIRFIIHSPRGTNKLIYLFQQQVVAPQHSIHHPPGGRGNFSEIISHFRSISKPIMRVGWVQDDVTRTLKNLRFVSPGNWTNTFASPVIHSLFPEASLKSYERPKPVSILILYCFIMSQGRSLLMTLYRHRSVHAASKQQRHPVPDKANFWMKHI